MALVLKDRVRETTRTTGVGAVVLLGASEGFQPFIVIGDGNTTYYSISLQGGSEWEIGIGTFTASTNTLARTTILTSSNSGSAVNFSVGVKDVFVTYPAEKAVYENAAGTIDGTLTGNATTATTLQTNRTLWGNNFNGSANITAPLRPQAGSSTAPAYSVSSDPNTGIYFPLADTIAFSTNGLECARISSTGLFNFQYGVQVFGNIDNLSGAVRATSGTATSPAFANSEDINTGMFFPAADTIAFTVGFTEVMRITSAGNVGIGRTNPSSKLDVNGTVTAPTFIGDLTGNAGTATTLQTARTIAITGDLAYTSGSFDGSGNVTGTGTLATVNSNVGSFTNANVTVNAKGLITAVSNGPSDGVTSVTGTSPVVSSGGTTPAISLASGYGDTQNPYASKTANFVLAAPDGAAGVPTFRAIVAADIPTLNQNTTGTASNVTGTVAIANGGTGATTNTAARTNLGATTLGANVFTITNPNTITFPRFNADNTVSTRSASSFRGDLGANTIGSNLFTLVNPFAITFPRFNADNTVSTLDAAGFRTAIGATTLGANVFRITNPSAITFPRFNADNTVTALNAADFRGAIGAGTSSTNGTVTSVGGTGTVSGISLSGTVTTSGNLTLGGTLAVTPSNFASQTANTFLSAPNGAAGVPTFRAIVAADVPVASASASGIVTTAAQSFNGAKTFQTVAANQIIASELYSGFTNNPGQNQFYAFTHLFYNADGENGGPASELMRLTEGGNLGIGTNNPLHMLSVAGTGNFTGTVNAPTFTGTFTGSLTTRTSTTASTTSITPNTASFDMIAFTALASALTINAPTGSPLNGTKLLFRILDNGTARDLNWNGTYTPIGVTLPITTVVSKTVYVGCIYNANNTRWDVIAVTTQA